MIIKILGSGCPNCQMVKANTKQAIGELQLRDAQIEEVRDVNKIISYGVMSTPAIVIDEELKAAGKIPTVEEIKAWLNK